MIIKCNTPEAVRDQIADWLASLAITYDAQARTAERKTTQREMRLRADTISAAAKFIKEIQVEVL